MFFLQSPEPAEHPVQHRFAHQQHTTQQVKQADYKLAVR